MDVSIPIAKEYFPRQPNSELDENVKDELKAYRLWIEYLKEAPPHTWSDEVRIDFSGCHSHATDSKEFEKWIWEANYNRGLFFDSNKALPTVIADDLADKPLDAKQITLVINITATDDDITSGVLAYVNCYREEQGWNRPGRGRPEFKAEPAKYELAMRPDVEALEITLDAYRLIKKHVGDKNWPKWRIGEEIVRKHRIGVKLRLKSPGPDREKELHDLVTRYEERAIRVIESVKNGVFPVK